MIRQSRSRSILATALALATVLWAALFFGRAVAQESDGGSDSITDEQTDNGSDDDEAEDEESEDEASEGDETSDDDDADAETARSGRGCRWTRG